MSHPKKIDRTAASEHREQLTNDEFIKLLAGTTLFRGIPPTSLSLDTLMRISAVVTLKPLAKNEALPIELHDPNKLFVYEILSGYVKIYDRRVSKSETRRGIVKNPPALLAWRVPGELLGDFQFTIPDETREDNIVATDDCVLLRIPAPVIRELAQRHPQLYFNVAANLASKAVKGRIRAQILRLKPTECMVAKLFIELLGERNADQTIADRIVVNGTFFVDDIAAFLGHSYHSAQDAISKLIKRKLIDHHGSDKSGRFEICNLEGLHQFLADELVKMSKQRSEKKNGSNQRTKGKAATG